MNTILEKLIKKTLDNKIEWMEEGTIGGYSFDIYYSSASYKVRAFYDAHQKSHIIQMDNYTILALTDEEFFNLRTLIQNSIIKRRELYNAYKVASLTKILEQL